MPSYYSVFAIEIFLDGKYSILVHIRTLSIFSSFFKQCGKQCENLPMTSPEFSPSCSHCKYGLFVVLSFFLKVPVCPCNCLSVSEHMCVCNTHCVCMCVCVCVCRSLCLYVAVLCCVFPLSCSRREQAGSPGAIVPVAATWQEVSRSFQLQHLLWCPFGEESARKKGCMNFVCLNKWHHMYYFMCYMTGSKPETTGATLF